MPRNDADDLHVIIGKTEGRRFRCPAKPGSSCMRSGNAGIHITAILPRAQPRPASAMPATDCPCIVAAEHDQPCTAWYAANIMRFDPTNILILLFLALLVVAVTAIETCMTYR